MGHGTTPVPLIFNATGTTSVTGGYAYGQVEVGTPGGGLNACSAGAFYASSCTGEPPAFSSAVPFSLAPGTQSDISISVACNLETTGTCSASIDPMIEIDPTFADANQYSLVFSPAVGSTATPEPSSLPLLGVSGLLVLLGLKRKKLGAWTKA
jgi:hypothetical protein